MDSTTTTSTTATLKYCSYSRRDIPLVLILVLVILLNNILILSILPLISTTTTTSSTLESLQNSSSYIDELDAVLGRASMGTNKTIIIAVVNKAYVEGKVAMPDMLDLFLKGFWHGEGTRELLSHLMIVSVDQMAYERCRLCGLHCYHLSTDGQDFMGEKVYMSKGFINMMWRRTHFLTQVLNKGYSFIFTDMDVIWLRNPFPILTADDHQDFDIQFSTDVYNGHPTSTKNSINTGFYFVKSNSRTISLFEKWYGLKDKYPRAKEQDVIQNMARQGLFGELGLKFRFLETWLFSGFCQKTSDIRYVITVHANCCRYISAKVVDLSKVLHEWVRFRPHLPNATATVTSSSFQFSKHVECKNSWGNSSTPAN